MRTPEWESAPLPGPAGHEPGWKDAEPQAGPKQAHDSRDLTGPPPLPVRHIWSCSGKAGALLWSCTLICESAPARPILSGSGLKDSPP